MLEDEELDAVGLESTRTIDIDCFVPADSIGWWSFERCGMAARPSYFKGIKGKPDPKEKKRLASLVAEHTEGWSPSLATDPVERALRSMIEAKQKDARRSTKKPATAKGGKIIDLVAVLKKSLQGGLPQQR